MVKPINKKQASINPPANLCAHCRYCDYDRCRLIDFEPATTFDFVACTGFEAKRYE